MILLTELTSNQGTICKKYSVNPDGSHTVVAAPAIYDATSKTIPLEFGAVGEYLNNLAKSPEKCILLGVHGNVDEEFQLTTEANVSDGKIARTKEFFDWCNSGNISLVYLDFDSNASDALRQRFLSELDIVLRDALIGETSSQRTQICRWLRPSTSASVEINGKQGTGLHVFLPVKKCNNELVKLIHRWCWLTSPDYRGYKVSKAGSITSESLIDPAVGSPERVVYSSDAIVEGPEEYYKHIARTCSYQPGGVLDAEIAIGILRELTVKFEKDWATYKKIKENAPDVITAKTAWISEQTEKNIQSGMTVKEAKKSAQSLSNSILLSNVILKRVGGEEVRVSEILSDPDKWLQKDKFNDPIKCESERNVGKIMGQDKAPFLHSFSHGGVKYALQWTYEDLLEWIETANEDEIDDWFSIHAANTDASDIQLEKLSKAVAKKVGVSVVAVRKEVKAKLAEKTSENDVGDEIDPKCMYGVTVAPDASHGDIMEDYIRNTGDCKTFGGSVYSWEGGTIWQQHTQSVIKKNLWTYYNHVDHCQIKSDYLALAGMVVNDSDVNVLQWNEAFGFPCSDGFYLIKDEKVEKVEYTKDLMCRFRMGIKPDFSMKTPLFDKILANIENPVLFQQLFGLAVSGYLNKAQKVMVMKGTGGAGKGTIENVMMAMLPTSRVTTVSLDQLNQDYFRAHIAQSRVNFMSEVRTGKGSRKIDITGLKEITGGGIITARFIYSSTFNFRSTCSFVISMNDNFALSPVGPETERRFGHSMVQFTKGDAHHEIIGLADMIIADELPGVLAWAIEGVKMYFQHGLEDSLSMELYKRWELSTDPVALFLEENVNITGSARDYVDRAEMWKRFQDFCSKGGYGEWRKGDFFADLDKYSKIGPIKKADGIYKVFRVRWS